MFNRSRRRLAYWFTLSMGSILILFAFTVYQRQVKEQMQEFDTQIYTQTKKIASLTTYQQQEKSWQINTDNVFLSNPEIPNESRIVYVRWYDSQKNLLQFIGNCPPQKSLVTSGWQTLKYNCNLNGGNKQKHLRKFTLPLKYNQSLVGYLQVAVSINSVRDSLARSRFFLALGVPITLGFTGIVGWILAGLAMQPVKLSYEQLQRFTADASHELRAPVAAILSNAQVGLLAPAEDRHQPRQRLENIVTQSKHISVLITNLLFLARHQGKLNPQDITKTDVVELLNSLANQYQVLAAEKGLDFQLNLPTTSQKTYGDRNMPTSYADRDLLQQAIHNLLDNAVKYTPSGGMVALTLEVKPRRILITVQDTGIGIPASDLPHIFDRFYRVDKARTRQTGGFGLGLAIAQQIIEAHNGKITVESKAGKGTKFQICLPLRSRSIVETRG
ncbi:Two-component sensor histidine kinase [Hyella patelloides LEGE 07179]|uniref:histidine kinase n=1 Tax=Hyella patelloides LEGE 07179 TaxID=945734 RepID=A0A563W4K5_9CYAN|nr:HAMP domain-containing sensor histidine kinase [Hyella patelloides]VEP18618.1 Two-component sensor histidine kinase [Hyella patelloides LEGE 07179]